MPKTQEKQEKAVIEQGAQNASQVQEVVQPPVLEEGDERDVIQFDKSERSIPFLYLAQKQSQVCEEQSDIYMEGVRPGDIVSSDHDRFWPGETGVLAIPLHYEHFWKESDPQGEYLGRLEKGDERVLAAEWRTITRQDGKKAARLFTAEGTTLDETHTYWCLIIDPDDKGKTPHPYAISLKGAQNKVAKGWNALISNQRSAPKNGVPGKLLPPYYVVYLLRSKGKPVDRQTIYGWVPRFKEYTDPTLRSFARDLAREIQTHAVEYAQNYMEKQEAKHAKKQPVQPDGGDGELFEDDGKDPFA